MTSPTVTNNVVRIPEVNLADFRAKATKLAAKAQKAGLPFAIVETGIVQEEILREDPVDGRLVRTGLFRTYFLFDITTPEGALKLAGWSLLGVIDYLPGSGEPIVREVPGRTVPAEFRVKDTFCEHCQTARYRKQTFIVAHEDGRVARVGRNCLADFLGVDAALLLQAMQWIATFRAAGEDERFGYGRPGTPTYAPQFILTVASRTIAKSGYVSRKAADAYNAAAGDDRRRTTAEEVHTYIDALEGNLPKYTNRYGKLVDQNKEVIAEYGLTTDADKAQAEQVLAFAKSLQGGSTYEYNLRTIAANEVVTAREFGILVSAFSGWKRTQEAAVAAATPAGKRASQWIAKVNERVAIKGATVTMTRALDGAYGPRTLVVFETPQGDRVKWFASGAQETTFPTGRVFDLVATVKEHGEFRDVRETVITRAVATEVQ